MSEKPVILWFRRDLRLSDHPALIAAAAQQRPVVPVYMHAPNDEGGWVTGSASRWWLHQSLASLQTDLKARGLTLVLKTGLTLEVLQELARETGADALYFNRRIEPAQQKLEARLTQELETLDIKSFLNDTLFEPGRILTQGARTPYKVFTPFYNACRTAPEPPRPASAPETLKPFTGSVSSLSLDALGLMPHLPWYKSIAAVWNPGESAGNRQLQTFIETHLADYPRLRDRPDTAGTSRLSPYLHFGEVSIRQVWWAVYSQPERHEVFLKELLWREFARHVLHHFPHTAENPFDPRFKRFTPRQAPQAIRAWQEGKTGYPAVDAAMRELWTTGWMHNRMRMVVASFLFKDLQLDWLEGARWFWDTLVDADLANNTLGWQWAAGCGVDAAPYFRIFNPVSQGKKFDPAGRYVRHWVPEIAALPDKFIHQPWKAPKTETYPQPIVDHDVARNEALKLWEAIKT